MFDRRLLENFAWFLLGLTVILGLFGLASLYSAVATGTQVAQKMMYFQKQLVWYAVGFVLMIASFLFDYKKLERWAPEAYVFCIILLVCVIFAGKHVRGSSRWLMLGPMSIQPSELAKIGVIIALAGYYSRTVNPTGFTLRELIRPLVLVAVPFALIAVQPDLGTAMVVALIAGSIAAFVKIERRSLLWIVSFFTVTVPFTWFLLKEYHKQRILAFFDPNSDPLGAGYHAIQSRIAIGSGMVSGKGFMQGTQNALSFLPDEHTDFIFSVLSEEWGFVGSGILLAAFLLLVIWGLKIAHECRDPFGIILSVGITAMIFWQVFINIGMVMGLMPVVGVPLPFISYGGSSVITTMISVGLLLNVRMRRFMVD